jgi:hypothetical protein
MRVRICLAILLLVVLMASSGAWADYVTYKATPDPIGPFTLNGGANALTVPQWNSSLFPGKTLYKVTLTYDGDVIGTIKYENLGTGENFVTGTLKADMWLKDPNGVQLLTVAPTTSASDTLPGYDGTIDFGGTSGRTYTNQTGSAQSIWWDTTSPYLTMFSGIGTVALTTGGTASSSATDQLGKVASSFITNGQGSVEIRYDYNGTDVPEPCTLGLGALCLVGLGLWRKRRSK